MLECANFLKCAHNQRRERFANPSNLVSHLILENAENYAMIQKSYAAGFVRRSDAFGR